MSKATQLSPRITLCESNWQTTRATAVATSGLKGSRAKIYGQLLENTHKSIFGQRKYLLSESAGEGQVGSGDVATFATYLMPVIKRTIQSSILPDLVPTVALKTPTANIYSLRYVYGNTVDANGTDTKYDIVGGQTEMFAAGAAGAKTSRFYSGNSETGKGATTTVLEGAASNKITIKTLPQSVTAKSRKLTLTWTPEAQMDLKTQHNLDIESDLVVAGTAELSQAIDNEGITDLFALANNTSGVDLSVAQAEYGYSFVGDKLAGIVWLINKVSARIAAKIRKQGKGATWLVVDADIAAALTTARYSNFQTLAAGTVEVSGNTQLIGTLHGMKVYSYSFLNYDNYGVDEHKILLGYKGPGETDGGYYYCTYLPITTSPVTVAYDTFTPHMQLWTRYATAAFTETATSLGNSGDYYGKVTITSLDAV